MNNTLPEILDVALGGRKIEAIKMLRENGMEAYTGFYRGVRFDEPSAGCDGKHEYRADGPEGPGTYAAGESFSFRCYAALGLKDAKDLVERLMLKANGAPFGADVLQLSGELINIKAKLSLACDERDTAERLESEYQAQLAEEQKAARVNEQRLGKALRQVEGLKDKLTDRNFRLQDMSANLRAAEQRVRELEKVIADEAIRKSFNVEGLWQ